MKKLVIALLLVFLGGVGIWYFAVATNRVVAYVGDVVVHLKEVEYRQAVSKLQDPKTGPKVGREHLIRDLITVEIAKRAGCPVTDELLSNEEARLDRVVKPGSFLASIREVFGSDKAAFRKVYLAPQIAERRLRQEYFPSKAPAQIQAKQKAQSFLEASIQNPKGAKELAKTFGVVWEPVTVSAEQGLIWGPAPKRTPERVVALERRRHNGLAEFWLRRIADDKPGTVHASLEEWGRFWLAVRVLSIDKKRGLTKIEAVKFPQANYVDWLKSESAKVTVLNN